MLLWCLQQRHCILCVCVCVRVWQYEKKLEDEFEEKTKRVYQLRIIFNFCPKIWPLSFIDTHKHTLSELLLPYYCQQFRPKHTCMHACTHKQNTQSVCGINFTAAPHSAQHCLPEPLPGLMSFSCVFQFIYRWAYVCTWRYALHVHMC